MSAKIAITIAQKIMFANRKSVQLVVAIHTLIGLTDISANHSKGVRKHEQVNRCRRIGIGHRVERLLWVYLILTEPDQ